MRQQVQYKEPKSNADAQSQKGGYILTHQNGNGGYNDKAAKAQEVQSQLRLYGE